METWNWIVSMMLWYLTKVVPPVLWNWMVLVTLIISLVELVDALSQGSIWRIAFYLSTIHLALLGIIIPWITAFAPGSTADEFRRSAREYVKSTCRSLLASLRNYGGMVWSFSKKSMTVDTTPSSSHSNSSKSDTGN